MSLQDGIYWANQQLGKPYIYGGGHSPFPNLTAPGYDCSGFASNFVYACGYDNMTSCDTVHMKDTIVGIGGAWAEWAPAVHDLRLTPIGTLLCNPAAGDQGHVVIVYDHEEPMGHIIESTSNYGVRVADYYDFGATQQIFLPDNPGPGPYHPEIDVNVDGFDAQFGIGDGVDLVDAARSSASTQASSSMETARGNFRALRPSPLIPYEHL